MATPWNKLIPVNRLGLPYHGLVTNGDIALPNGDTVSGAGVGPSLVLRSPSPPSYSRTAEQTAYDSANGQEFRDYVLLGTNGVLGGTLLQDNGHPLRIYFDSNGVPWTIECDFGFYSLDTYTGTVDIRLHSLFGRFGCRDYPLIDRQLDSVAVDLTDPNNGSGTNRWELPFVALISHNEDGSGIKACIYTRRQSNPSGTGVIKAFEGLGDNIYLAHRLEAIVTVTLAGDGDTDPSNLGDGITGTVVVDKPGYKTSVNQNTTYTRRRDQNDVDSSSGEKIICGVTDTIELGSSHLVGEEHVAEFFVGNSVRRITQSDESENFYHKEYIRQGCYNCTTFVDNVSADATLYRKDLTTVSWTLADGGQQQDTVGYGETADNIFDSYSVNCQVGQEGIEIIETAEPPPPDTSSQPGAYNTCSIQNDAVWIYSFDQPTIVCTAGGTTTTNIKNSATDAGFVATNPETGDILVSTDQVAYV